MVAHLCVSGLSLHMFVFVISFLSGRIAVIQIHLKLGWVQSCLHTWCCCMAAAGAPAADGSSKCRRQGPSHQLHWSVLGGGIMWCTYLHIFAHILHIFLDGPLG